MAQLPDLPPVSSPNFLDRLREQVRVLAGYTGMPSDWALRPGSLRNLAPGGSRGTYVVTGTTDAPYERDLTPPPTPTGLTVAAGFTYLIIQCDAAFYTQGHGHGRTVVYGTTRASGGPLPTFADAHELTQFQGTVFAHPVPPHTIWHIWIKWETVDGVKSESPAGGTNGVQAITGQVGPGDVSDLAIEAQHLAEGAIDLSTNKVVSSGNFGAIAVGYTVTQYLIATSGLLGNLVVDNAQIANLSASKITSGSIGVGQYIGSPNYVGGAAGWRIFGSGGAEFTGAVVRGTIYAETGRIGGETSGIVIGPGYIKSTNWNDTYSPAGTGWAATSAGDFYINNASIRGQINVGSFSGFGWPAAGTTGAHLGPQGLMIGNYNNGRYFYADVDGVIQAPGLSIIAGNAVYSGALSAASGSFAGSLSAATGTFSGVLTAAAVNAVDSVNIAGEAVTIPRSVAAGSAINLLAGTEQTLCTLPTFISKGGQVVIIFGGVVSSPPDDVVTGNWRVRRNGTEIFSTSAIVPQSVMTLPPVTDQPGVGSVTYTVTYVPISTNGATGAVMTTRAAYSLETVK
ncbi:MAG: hypothetical protein JWQ03_591 [Variovorax sp.]|nr:hypothetical protein [Variovorax sp.]